jgi:hypothetical protein
MNESQSIDSAYSAAIENLFRVFSTSFLMAKGDPAEEKKLKLHSCKDSTLTEKFIIGPKNSFDSKLGFKINDQILLNGITRHPEE